jgi:hypothetical protein
MTAAERSTAVTELIRYGHSATAIEFLAIHLRPGEQPIDATQAVAVLEGVARGMCAQENVDWGECAYEISLLMDAMDTSEEIEGGRIARLEWLFLPILQHQRPPRRLNRALADEPGFFVELLTLMYRAEGEEGAPATPETRALAERAYHVLHDWSVLPGTTADGLDGGRLEAWVLGVRARAEDAKRKGVADYHIGEALSRSPMGADGLWPHEAVREIIENVSSERLDQGVSLGVYNSRGVVSRGIGDGGAQERILVEKYRAYAEGISHSWPRTARTLRSIADRYDSHGRLEDVRAELDDELWR